MNEPLIQVGILLEQKEITFELLTLCTFNGHQYPPAIYSVRADEGRILFEGGRYDTITFEPDSAGSTSFELKEVVIGINFHWERKEHQRFAGSLTLMVENNALTAVNNIALEDYLKSVISSEMSATASQELLKAHAVISRSWLLAQIEKSGSEAKRESRFPASVVTATEIIRWYDREEHDHFDVCADDHCQRYQGITRQSTPLVRTVIDETRGEVLTYDGTICDARFSKCCGGIIETFENVWEPVVHPYLQAKRDFLDDGGDASHCVAGASTGNAQNIPTETAYSHPFPDLTIEANAEKWIRSTPPAFCNTDAKEVLRQVLNDYDRETVDFYRWQVRYTQRELASLIRERSGIDFGAIIALEPLERGASGRLIRLKIIGTQRVMTIGKELEIRRTLSPSHLYSSAFVVDAEEENAEGIPQRFTLTGAGWGHGVGLCQIGAAMMAEKGFGYREILQHYFPGSEMVKRYD